MWGLRLKTKKVVVTDLLPFNYTDPSMHSLLNIAKIGTGHQRAN